MRTLTFLLVAIGAFLVMEPLTALAHRAVMHGFGWSWHRDHHNPRAHGFERNDRFPIVFALVAAALIITGASVPVVWFLLPVGIGITVYGVTYAIVHDLAIHRRLGPFRPRGRVVEYLSTAHAEHHRANGAPYGMLWPVMARVPQSRG